MCITAGLPGCASWQGTWGSKRASKATKGPMVTAATVDASALRSAGRCGLSPLVSRARCLRAAVQATTLQFVRSGLAPSTLRLPLSCTVVVASDECPCSSASGPCPCGGAGGASCGKRCAPPRFRCVSDSFCRRCSGAAPGRKKSWCRNQWPCGVDGLRSASHCPTMPPAWFASTRRCSPRRASWLDVPAGGIWACR